MLTISLDDDGNIMPLDANQSFLHAMHSNNLAEMGRIVKSNPEVLEKAYEGFTANAPLHIAAQNGVVEHVKWLLQHGAPWNLCNHDGNCAGDLAFREGQQECHEILVQWAVEQGDGPTSQLQVARIMMKFNATDYQICFGPPALDSDPDSEFRARIYSLPRMSNDAFVHSQIMYTDPMDDGIPSEEQAMITLPDGTGIMMEWERPIMEAASRLLFAGHPHPQDIRVLNIGFGIGMIDTYIQEHQPGSHVIIEAHPICLGWMENTGWFKKPNVRVINAKWQDVVRGQCFDNRLRLVTLEEELGQFDIIYFDTFQESYPGHMDFIKHLPSLLKKKPTSRFSFFHGHGANKDYLYDVWTKIAGMHMNDLGLMTEWHKVPVDLEKVWFKLPKTKEARFTPGYSRVPICSWAPTVRRTVKPGWNAPLPVLSEDDQKID